MLTQYVISHSLTYLDSRLEWEWEREWAWKGNEKITRYHLARINERITKTNESTEMRDASQANIQFINDGHDIVKLIWWDTSQKNCMWKKRRMMSILAGCWDK